MNARGKSKELGDAGEAHALSLLRSRGYEAHFLGQNAPTYDIEASKPGRRFLVSVKVARDKQHVRLGARSAVTRLVEGNFLFAYIPRQRDQEISFSDPSKYRLLILPADVARSDSLPIHDAYWAAKEKPPVFSVMVKGYGSHHRAVWPRWLQFEDAWHQLP